MPPGRAAGPPRVAAGRSSVPVDPDLMDARRAAGGDGRAFERLYRKHVPRVHSLARRMLSPTEADEMTQDVFVRAWTKLATFRGDAAFGTWLHRLAINLILEKRSSLGLQRSRLDDREGVLDRLTVRPARADLSMDFEAAIERLPDGARRVFVLHDVEGYKHREIAGMLGTSPGTSKAQLHRARMILRRYLRPSAGGTP
jgi:RNA polymerase sigma-70 factor (ECF subfamily)